MTTSTSTSTSPSEVFPLLTPAHDNVLGVRIARSINDIRANNHYLAHPHLPSLVDFKAGGRSTGDKLVLAADVDSNDAQPVEVCLLAKVHDFDHFLSPDGNDVLKRDDTAPPNTRLRVALCQPKHSFCAAIDSDWQKMIDNVGKIAKKMLKKGLPVRLPLNRDGHDIVACHKIMMKKSESDTEPDKDSSEATSSEDEVDNAVDAVEQNDIEGFDLLFTVKGWPATPRWHALADKFDDSHSAVPLPAYDEFGTLIHPENYEKKLAGATVQAKLCFVGYCIGGKTNVLVSEIQELRIVIPAIKLPSSASKRRRTILQNLVKRRKVESEKK